MKRIALVLVASAAFCVAGCDNVNRSLVFFTNTTAGVDVGIDPSTSSGRVIIGYKRAEGVINPVYQPSISKEYNNELTADRKASRVSRVEHHKVTDLDDVYREEAYSVLAKIAGEAGGRGAAGQAASVDAAGKIAQWFATGKAADYLAKNEYAAAALTGSNDVAKAISGGVQVKADEIRSTEDLYSRVGLLTLAADDLDRWSQAENADPEAVKHADRLRRLSRAVYVEVGDFSTVQDNGAGTPLAAPFPWTTGSMFVRRADGAVVSWSTLVESERYLQSLADGARPGPPMPQLSEIKNMRAKVELLIAESDAIQGAIGYWIDKLGDR